MSQTAGRRIALSLGLVVALFLVAWLARHSLHHGLHSEETHHHHGPPSAEFALETSANPVVLGPTVRHHDAATLPVAPEPSISHGHDPLASHCCETQAGAVKRLRAKAPLVAAPVLPVQWGVTVPLHTDLPLPPAPDQVLAQTPAPVELGVLRH